MKFLLLRVDRVEAQRVANLFNCKLGQFPLNYLGVAIGDSDVKKKAIEKIIGKLENRLGT